jgi:hypothetical protein
LTRIRAAIRNGSYDMTMHASEEMAEDALDIVDVETSILNGRLVKLDNTDPRGTKHIVYGAGSDRTAQIGTVGRFTESRRYLLITVYKITEA